MDDDDALANLVWPEVFEHDGYTTYATRGRDVAISYFNVSDELVVFELNDTDAGLNDNETLMGIPDGERSFEVEPEELAGLIAAFANMNAERPIFEDYFLGLRVLWLIIAIFEQVGMPAKIVDAAIVNDNVDDKFDHLIDPNVEIEINERVIVMMIMLSRHRGNIDRLFDRYVVINDEPMTTDDIDEAVLEKLRLGGKLLDLRTTWHP